MSLRRLRWTAAIVAVTVEVAAYLAWRHRLRSAPAPTLDEIAEAARADARP